jgi:hypothetical protein
LNRPAKRNAGFARIESRAKAVRPSNREDKEMRERIDKDFFGNDTLIVYPYLRESEPDFFMASAGSIEAVRYVDADGVQAKGVRMNIGFNRPISRDETDELKAAIDRCWQWFETGE